MDKTPALPSRALIEADVQRALAEDIGTGDLTAQLVPDVGAHAELFTREDAVLCGTAWVDELFRRLDTRVHVTWLKRDGERIAAGDVIARLNGPARTLLTGERGALNFLQTLSGTATLTARYVEALRGTRSKVLDTRKTIPGLRRAQKYAVTCGGGHNHRFGLYDAILIKENHIAAVGSVAEAVQIARRQSPLVMIEVEVESLEQFREALATDADRIMLDDFSLDDMRAAVRLRDASAGKRHELEASGSVDATTLRDVAATGVDFISMGALTKHLRAIDFSMRFV